MSAAGATAGGGGGAVSHSGVRNKLVVAHVDSNGGQG